MNQDDRTSTEGTPEEAAVEARRDALKRIGIYGAMTGPVMMALLSSKASAQVQSTVDNLTNSL